MRRTARHLRITGIEKKPDHYKLRIHVESIRDLVKLTYDMAAKSENSDEVKGLIKWWCFNLGKRDVVLVGRVFRQIKKLV